MSFEDKIRAIAARVDSVLGHLQTEEAAKNALVMPFLGALGYDVFNPLEVVPEYTADVGIKKGEKVDYAIKRDGAVVMLVECKKADEELRSVHASQLYRYFSVTPARVGILTNGVRFQFFSDTEERNRMDLRPFLDLDLRNMNDDVLSEVAKLSKERFDLESVLNSASELMYLAEIRKAFEEQFENPDDEFVRFFFAKANPEGRFTQTERDRFTGIVRRALRRVVSDRVSARLKSALDRVGDSAPSRPVSVSVPQAAVTGDDDGIVTTEDELEGYRIVCAIVCGVVPVSRIVHRDQKSYFGILFDDNNRKPICRLHFNRAQKYIGLIDESKEETRHPIAAVSDIYAHAEHLRGVVTQYAAEP